MTRADGHIDTPTLEHRMENYVQSLQKLVSTIEATIDDAPNDHQRQALIDAELKALNTAEECLHTARARIARSKAKHPGLLAWDATARGCFERAVERSLATRGAVTASDEHVRRIAERMAPAQRHAELRRPD